MAVTRAKDSEIKAAFQKFDKDNSGSLEIGELYDVLREIGVEITKEHFDGYSQIMMDDFDTDRSGALDYDEFTRFYEQVLVNESGKGQYKEMLELKEEGNTFFRSGDYLKAAATYTKAIKAAADHGIDIQVGDLARSDLYTADEIFVVGTAAEVSAVNSVDDRPVPCPGPATKVLADAYADLVRGRNETYRAWNELAS